VAGLSLNNDFPQAVTFRQLESLPGSRCSLHIWPAWLWLPKILDPNAQEVRRLKTFCNSDSFLIRNEIPKIVFRKGNGSLKA